MSRGMPVAFEAQTFSSKYLIECDRELAVQLARELQDAPHRHTLELGDEIRLRSCCQSLTDGGVDITVSLDGQSYRRDRSTGVHATRPHFALRVSIP